MTREEAISQLDLCKSIIYASGQDWLDERDIPVLDTAIEALQEQKTGKWIDEHYSGFDGCRVWHRKCSVCGYERDDDNPDKDTNYCPNCGSKMEV